MQLRVVPDPEPVEEETPPEKRPETPRRPRETRVTFRPDPDNSWPRKVKITFTRDLDGRKPDDMILSFPNQKTEQEFFNRVKNDPVRGARKPFKDPKDPNKVIRLVDKNDKIFDSVEIVE